MSKCKNCGASITLVNYALARKWMHNPPGNTEMNGGPYGVFEYCRGAVAEPAIDTAEELSA